MSKQQIDQLRNGGKAASQFDVLAPMSGTVTDRLAVEGAYVQEGQPVFRLADLSTVWLQLKLFPNDASTVRIGQTVKAQLKSMPDQDIYGHIAFIDPAVNQASRTVSVRVVLDNESGNIRIGDYAKATVEAPVSQDIARDALVVPRNSILSAADHSIVYVETETGRFEIRRVITGPSNGPSTVITKGLAEGEKVATSGNFLIDSQMQLAGNPSLIDPSRAAPPLEMVAGFTAKELAEIQQLPDSEQSLAIEQIICPVTEYKLGSMGVPLKVEVDNQVVFICCLACKEDVLQDPQLHLAKIAAYKRDGPTDAQEVDAFEVPEIGEIEMIVD
jgi:hypothetical protein